VRRRLTDKDAGHVGLGACRHDFVEALDRLLGERSLDWSLALQTC
jgi:hypothetical protein